MKRHTIGYIKGVSAAISYGTNPLFALPLFSVGIGVNSVLFYRYIIASIIYGLWLVLVKKVSLKLEKKEILPIFILAILFSLSSVTLFDAFNYIASGIACTILFIYPTIVALIMFLFFKEKPSKSLVFAIFLATIGIILLYNPKSNEPLNLHGILMVLASALCYALYMIGIKKIKAIERTKYNKLAFYVMLLGTLVYVVNLKFCTELQAIPNVFLWACVLLLAIIPTIISIETISVAVKLIGSTKTAILGALEPITALIFGVILFHEQLTLLSIVGIGLILFGVILTILKK